MTVMAPGILSTDLGTRVPVTMTSVICSCAVDTCWSTVWALLNVANNSELRPAVSGMRCILWTPPSMRELRYVYALMSRSLCQRQGKPIRTRYIQTLLFIACGLMRLLRTDGLTCFFHERIHQPCTNRRARPDDT